MNVQSFLIGYQAAKKSAGSSEELRWVTFMSHDGTEELGRKPVAVGDDCADPIARGIFAKPTRPSTVSQDFEQNGWATTPNGEADSNALKSVTEDRVVYAAYKATTREYTIRFMDGDTVLESKSWAYGSTPSVANPEKDGCNFDRWEPAISIVTGDKDYFAQWTEALTFAGGSWVDIVAASETGQAPELFAIGDTRNIAVGDATITLRIIDFDHDNLADGSGKAGMTIWAETAMPDTMPCESWETLAETMRTVLKPKLPLELQSGIKTVKKPCADKGGGTVYDVNFDLFPLSHSECKITKQGTMADTSSSWAEQLGTLGEPYSYFETVYSSAYGGPNKAKWNTGYWMRQRWTVAQVYGMTTAKKFTSSSYAWAFNVSPTEQHPVMWAFCI